MQPEKLVLASASALPEELILRNFAATIGRKRYEHWFKQTQVWIEGDEVVVAVSTPFQVKWMSQNFRAGLLAASRPIIGDGACIRFEVRTESQSVNPGSMVPPAYGSTTSGNRTAKANPNGISGESEGRLTAGLKTQSDFTDNCDTRPTARPALKDAEDCGRTLRLHSGDSNAGPTPLKQAVAASAIAAQSKNFPACTSTSSAVENGRVTVRPNSKFLSAAEPTPVLPSANDKTLTDKTANEQPEQKPSGDKRIPSVSRVTRDSPLTLAKVKAVEEPPRAGRRFADLMDLVEGSCNEFALSAVRQVCQAPGVQFTTLFVHGPVGVGKTHVLEGIHRDLKQRFPSRQVVYLTAEAFANFFTQALRDHKLPSFRQKFRSIDVLIVDDIDFFDGKRGIQEEFLFTIQQLEAHGRMVVVAAHGHPRLLTKISDELRTRFLAGMVCRIDAPDVATRKRIVENKALRAGADFAPDVFQFVADRFRNNVRELEGAFNTLLAYQKMQKRRLSLTAARQALADLERDCIRAVRMVDIEQAVCSMFGVTVDDLKSAKRQKAVSQPRMLAMYLARKHTRAAYNEIGQHFGGRNHSTVMAAEKKIQASMTEPDPIVIRTQPWRVADVIEALEQQLQAG